MKTLHVISHTHWDREWYQTFQQFRLRLVHLIDQLLDILAEDCEFKHFMLDGQTIVLDDYLQMRPEKEAVLRKYVQEGRILIGPWHILPDMFLVSPEAHIRNLLSGARTAGKLGPKMPVGYIPDPFGHPGQIPQILRGFNIEAACLWRGVSDLPVELWWEAPDGSRVFLAHLRDSYSNGAYLPTSHPEQFTHHLSAAQASLAAHSAVADHLIMLGTDHMEPSRQTSAAIAYANDHLPGAQVIHSTLPNYIERVVQQISAQGTSLPVVQGELRACERSPLLPGVLSTRMWIKQRNHRNQMLLEKWAEPFSVFAEHMLDENPPAARSNPGSPASNPPKQMRNLAPIIRQAWRLAMENHPHDSICGCSIDQVHDEMKPRFDQTEQIGEEITRQALQAIAQAAGTSSEGVFSAIVLFNPLGSARRDLVEVELNIPAGIAAYELVDAEQNILAHTPQASTVRFVSPEIPAFGWCTVWVRALPAPGTAPAARVSAGGAAEPPYRIENEYFLVEASLADGTLTVTDKQTRAVFSGLNRFVDGGDAGDEYNYCPPPEDAFYSPQVVSIRALRERQIPCLEIEYALPVPEQLAVDRNSRSPKLVRCPIISRVTLAPGVARVDINTEVNNLAKDHRLRVHFPAPIRTGQADYDGHFEVVRRPVGVPVKGAHWVEHPRPEVPQRAFTDVSDESRGLMVANRGLPEVEVFAAGQPAHTEIALTLLRCVGWLSRDDLPVRPGHAGPGLATPGGQMLGAWSYDYAIIPHAGHWSHAYPQAYAFETPLRAIPTDLHRGTLPCQGSFISHSPAEFIISAVKETEDGQGWLVRGYNLTAQAIQLHLKPLRKIASAHQVNLAEEKIAALVQDKEGGVSLPVAAQAIVSIMFSDCR